jgi:hypothetical protein
MRNSAPAAGAFQEPAVRLVEDDAQFGERMYFVRGEISSVRMLDA